MRDLRLDLLKVLAMFGIVLIHSVYSMELHELVEYGSTEWLLIMLLYTFFFSATNVFVLVSSYFLYEGGFRWSKVMRMAFLTSCYSVGIAALLMFFKQTPVSLKVLVECALSPFNNQYWFITSYLALYILSPYLNKMLHSLPKKDLMLLCGLLLLGFSVAPSVLLFEPAQSFLDPRNGKSLAWFIVLYCCVFLFKKHLRNSVSQVKAHRFLVAFLLCVCALFSSYILLHWISIQLGMGGDGEARLYFDSSILVAGASFSMFLFFIRLKRISLSETSVLYRLVVSISASTLSVYLIHEQALLKPLLWGTLESEIVQNSESRLLAVLMVSLVLFLCCVLFDLIRRALSKQVSKLWKRVYGDERSAEERV